MEIIISVGKAYTGYGKYYIDYMIWANMGQIAFAIWYRCHLLDDIIWSIWYELYDMHIRTNGEE